MDAKRTFQLNTKLIQVTHEHNTEEKARHEYFIDDVSHDVHEHEEKIMVKTEYQWPLACNQS